jgi:hypothetical protein
MSQPVPPTVAGETPGENEEKVEDESQEAWPCVDGPMGNGCSAPAARERSRSPPATQAMPKPPMPPRPAFGRDGRWIYYPTAEDYAMARVPQYPPTPHGFHHVWVDGVGWMMQGEFQRLTGPIDVEPLEPILIDSTPPPSWIDPMPIGGFPIPQLDEAISGPPSDDYLPALVPSSSSDCDNAQAMTMLSSSSDSDNAQAMTARTDDIDHAAVLRQLTLTMLQMMKDTQ